MLSARIEGIGFWAGGLPSWEDACRWVRDGVRPEAPPQRPAPTLLAPNERRRAPESVAVALEVAQAACIAAGRDPATLPSVFASTHGDMAITDYMCATLASQPDAISPTKFHNSVHNAAAGYWTIGHGCMHATTAISASDASFAQALLEAMTQLACGADAVLLVAYDIAARGALASLPHGDGLLGGALVLSSLRQPAAASAMTTGLQVTLREGSAPANEGTLHAIAGANAMAPMLALFEALARGTPQTFLKAGPGRLLHLEIQG
ncbi:beta-ketoacyl synthase chain length factor [Luteimonas sp. RIT-PG2_3]